LDKQATTNTPFFKSIALVLPFACSIKPEAAISQFFIARYLFIAPTSFFSSAV
jgi:hypothetical protein